MNNILLTFQNENITLGFDDTLDTIRERLSIHESDYFRDETATVDEHLSYFDLGLEILFKDGILTCIFFYVHDQSKDYKAFAKSCSYLPEAFWNAPNLPHFQEIMVSSGFEEMTTSSRFTTKYVKDDVYTVYTKRPDIEIICFGLRSKF